MLRGRVVFGAMDEVMFGDPAADGVVAQAERLDARRVFLMVSGTLNRHTDEIDKVRKALGSRCAGLFDATQIDLSSFDTAILDFEINESGLLNRRLYKAIDVTAQAAALDWSRILAFDARVRERMTRCGFDPRYCFAEDSASDTPYEPYQPDAEKPARQIYVENGAGQVVEISTLSDALVQLRKTYTVLRYYVPAEFRDELRQIAAETLK